MMGTGSVRQDEAGTNTAVRGRHSVMGTLLAFLKGVDVVRVPLEDLRVTVDQRYDNVSSD